MPTGSSPTEALAKVLPSFAYPSRGGLEPVPKSAETFASELFTALTAAGYSLVRTAEVEALSVERIAAALHRLLRGGPAPCRMCLEHAERLRAELLGETP